MNGVIREGLEKVKQFFIDYGKVSVVGISFSAGLLSVCLIVSLVSPQKLRVSFLDIGQGDAILIQTPSGHTMLVDGGATDAVISRLGEQMRYLDRHMDVMLATHADADHITGLIPVLELYDVKTVVRSPVEATTGIADELKVHVENETSDVHTGQVGDEIDFGDGVIAHVLYPNKIVQTKTDTNSASVSIVLTYGEQSFLLTGDLPMKYEPQLIGKNLPKHVTVYKAGHHGSKTSSGDQLLKYIKPEYAVISAGKENKYGHPNQEAIERLQKYSKEILSTIDRGTITFATDGRMVEVETEK